MSNIDNLILEHLKIFQAGQDRIESKLDEHTQRLGRVEMAIAGLRLDQRVRRIEKRLDIAE